MRMNLQNGGVQRVQSVTRANVNCERQLRLGGEVEGASVRFVAIVRSDPVRVTLDAL